MLLLSRRNVRHIAPYIACGAFTMLAGSAISPVAAAGTSRQNDPVQSVFLPRFLQSAAAARPSLGSPSRSWISPRAQSEPLLYVSDYLGDYVNIYSQNGNDQAPIGQLSGYFGQPGQLYVSKTGDLYVANINGPNVPVFHRGATAPFETLNVPLAVVYAITEDSQGTVYVTGSVDSAATIEVYPSGSVSPTSSLSDPSFLQFNGVTTDSKGNLYACAGQQTSQQPHAVDEFLAGTTMPINLNLKAKGCFGLEIGPRDSLLVGDLQGRAVEVFPAGSTTPSVTIRDTGGPLPIALNANAADVYVGNANKSVSEYDRSGRLVDTITNGITQPAVGIATDPGYFPY